MICSANQWTGFFLISASVMKGLKKKNGYQEFYLNIFISRIIVFRSTSNNTFSECKVLAESNQYSLTSIVWAVLGHFFYSWVQTFLRMEIPLLLSLFSWVFTKQTYYWKPLTIVSIVFIFLCQFFIFSKIEITENYSTDAKIYKKKRKNNKFSSSKSNFRFIKHYIHTFEDPKSLGVWAQSLLKS